MHCTSLKKKDGRNGKTKKRRKDTHKESDRIATMNEEEEEKEEQNVGGMIEGLYGQRVESRTGQTMEWLVRE